jgi:hypothetical protein
MNFLKIGLVKFIRQEYHTPDRGGKTGERIFCRIYKTGEEIIVRRPGSLELPSYRTPKRHTGPRPGIHFVFNCPQITQITQIKEQELFGAGLFFC